MSTEETLVLVKPDGVARGLTGSILARIEAKGYALVDIRLVEPDRDRLEKHYAEHAGKPFYEPLLEFMMSRQGQDIMAAEAKLPALHPQLTGELVRCGGPSL